MTQKTEPETLISENKDEISSEAYRLGMDMILAIQGGEKGMKIKVWGNFICLILLMMSLLLILGKLIFILGR
jgi:hypothetical protein